MKANHNSLVIGLLAASALTVGMADDASAEVVDFKDNGDFAALSLTEGNVTVTGSAPLQVISGAGIGVIGGDSVLVNPGESLTFDFTTPVGDFSIVGYQANDSNGDGIAPAATFEGYDESGALIASISTSFNPAAPIDISNILGINNLSTFMMTMIVDNIIVGAISSQEAQGAPVLSCNGFAAPFDKDLVIKNRSKRTIPVVMTLTNADGVELTDQDIISPPVVTIAFNSSVAGTGSISDDSLLDPATSSQGNTFSYNVDTLAWEYRLSSRNLSSAGTYTVSVASGDDTEYVVDTTTQCTQSFTRLP